MKPNRLHMAMLAAMIGSAALVGCKKKEEPVVAPPAAVEPAPAPAEPVPAPMPVSATSVTVGNTIAADKSVAAVGMFGVKDKIIVSVKTDATTPADATIDAKLTFQDGQVAGEQNATLNTSGAETTNITFKNANGLTRKGHLSTARDMSTLGRRLFYDFPQYYNIFSRRETDAGVADVASTNRKFLDMYKGADGIKTGYTSPAGFNLTASARRGNKHIIATVFGGTSTANRNANSLVVADFADNIRRIRALASSIDRDSSTSQIVITQLRGGRVLSAKVGASCPYDEAGKRSIEAAVLNAQPLPYRGFEEVFSRQLNFTFTAQDN